MEVKRVMNPSIKVVELPLSASSKESSEKAYDDIPTADTVECS
jgi:hypothetical protein